MESSDSGYLILIDGHLDFRALSDYPEGCPPDGVLYFKGLYETNPTYREATEKRLMAKYEKNREPYVGV